MLPVRLRSRLAAGRLLSVASSSRHTSIRTYTSPTHPRSAPAVQYAEPDVDPLPPPYTPPSSSQGYYDLSVGIGPQGNPFMTRIPTALPHDIAPEPSSNQYDLYPSAGMIDAVSMIAICLRRPEHVPRAYQIFRQILEDAAVGLRSSPDAQTWQKVIEGAAGLGRETSGDVGYVKWRRAAERLVKRWEQLHAQSTGEALEAGMPVLAQGGIRIYQGWFAGMVSAQTSLAPILPYLQSQQLGISSLLEGLAPADTPLAYEALTQLARANGLIEMEEEVRVSQDFQKAQRERQMNEVVEEVKFVPERIGRGELAYGDAPRWAVNNLRRALTPISASTLPINRQRALEYSSLVAAQQELKRAHDKMIEGTGALKDSRLERNHLQAWMHEWLSDLTPKLQQELQAMHTRITASASPDVEDMGLATSSRFVSMKEKNLYLYLTLMSPDKLALISILELMRQIGGGGVTDGLKTLRGVIELGRAVETEWRAETIKSVAGVDSFQWQSTIDERTQKPSRNLVEAQWKRIGKRIVGQERSEQHAAEAETVASTTSDPFQSIWTPAWSKNALLDIGGFLMKHLLGIAKVTRSITDPETGELVSETQPAFQHAYEYLRGYKHGIIRVNPAVMERLGSDTLMVLPHPKALPMLVEPRKWTSHNEGGYLLHRTEIMRFKESPEQKLYIKNAIEQEHMEFVLHGLDVLSSTPWNINRNVFDVVLHVWNSGEQIADIPAAHEQVAVDWPVRPEGADNEPAVRAAYYSSMRSATKTARKEHGERCKFNYVIEVARAYVHDTFYLPHNMDFRGRAYPVPPHLSPVGDDLCRGLLRFGESRPLGTTGLKWLQIHLANVYGYDKLSFEQRARFAQDHEEEIFDSADRPLEGKRWWLQAEDPWQCLATCFELSAALRSPDPTAFESSLPVHQDGTCNGMQHYAALGGDIQGAKAVNLENGDRPSDVYTGVVDIVNKVIDQDKKRGKPSALAISEPLGRKIVKQTVMTTVYGVTYIGAREQIAKQLEARTDVAQADIFAVSSYIAKTVLSCIGDLFSGAKDIMDWLTVSASLISRSIPESRVMSPRMVPKSGRHSKSTNPRGGAMTSDRLPKEFMTSVIWTTPLGLPVVQPYRRESKKQLMTALQTVYIHDPNAPTEVHPAKQSSAFPPNFIHSLDATHMFLTALQCKQNQIIFASVHDSYWTHASTVEPMSELIRATFVDLHSQPIMAQLREEFLDRFGENLIPKKNVRSISSNARARKLNIKRKRPSLAKPGLSDSDGDPAADTQNADEDPTDLSAEQDVVGLDSAEAAFSARPERDSDDPEADSSGRSGGSGKSKEADVLTDAEIDRIANKKFTEIVINGQAYVRLKDVLPLTPERGGFDVNKIKDSRYFFS